MEFAEVMGGIDRACEGMSLLRRQLPWAIRHLWSALHPKGVIQAVLDTLPACLKGAI